MTNKTKQAEEEILIQMRKAQAEYGVRLEAWGNGGSLEPVKKVQAKLQRIYKKLDAVRGY